MRNQDDVQSDLLKVNDLASSESFRWFIGRITAKRQKTAALALRRCESVSEHDYIVGKIEAYDDTLGFLVREANILKNEMGDS